MEVRAEEVAAAVGVLAMVTRAQALAVVGGVLASVKTAEELAPAVGVLAKAMHVLVLASEVVTGGRALAPLAAVVLAAPPLPASRPSSSHPGLFCSQQFKNQSTPEMARLD